MSVALLLFAHHFHETFLEGVRRFRRPQTQGEGFMEAIAFGDEVFRLLSELPARLLEFTAFPVFQSSDNVEPCAVLEFFKAHL